jgi:hypothetical protein
MKKIQISCIPSVVDPDTVRIASDRHNFSGSGSGSIPSKLFSQENFNMLAKNTENYDTFDTDEKDKNIINWQFCD